jgi:hypothetical protein
MTANRLVPVLALGLILLPACSPRHSAPAPPKSENKEQMMWPTLPTKGFVAGRPATNDDVARGDAVFFLMGSGVVSLDIEIPLYAYHIEERSGKRTAGIIIQAERTADGKELVAMQPVDWSGPVVALRAEYQLLGKAAPKEN